MPDFKFKEIDTPKGKVKFIELIGVTNCELKEIMNKKTEVEELCVKLRSDVTDFRRKPVI